MLYYHIVWCVKHRYPILQGQVVTDLKEILTDIASDNEIVVLELETGKDHVHMLISCKSQHVIPSIMKAFKGSSARKLFLKHPELKNKLWGDHMWNSSYFVSTVSDNTEEQIKHYIQNQQIDHR